MSTPNKTVTKIQNQNGKETLIVKMMATMNPSGRGKEIVRAIVIASLSCSETMIVMLNSIENRFSTATGRTKRNSIDSGNQTKKKSASAIASEFQTASPKLNSTLTANLIEMTKARVTSCLSQTKIQTMMRTAIVTSNETRTRIAILRANLSSSAREKGNSTQIQKKRMTANPTAS